MILPYKLCEKANQFVANCFYEREGSQDWVWMKIFPAYDAHGQGVMEISTGTTVLTAKEQSALDKNGIVRALGTNWGTKSSMKAES